MRFAYGVASTVGLMMCHVFGVQDKRAYPFAVDLGVAMQITNIARDILEDAGRDRLYVPSTLLDTEVSCEGLAQGDEAHRSSAYQGALRMLAIADEYYASAALGYGYLPPSVRQAIKSPRGFIRQLVRKWRAIRPHTGSDGQSFPPSVSVC